MKSARVSYNGYYVTFPRLRQEFDSPYPHQRHNHLCGGFYVGVLNVPYAVFCYYRYMNIDDVVNKIRQSQFTNKPVIIAIDGFGGAGKSTLAKLLREKLGDAIVVEIDDFFLKDVPSDANKSNFDRKRLIKQVLQPLRDGGEANYQKLIWDSGTLSDYVHVPVVEYLIVEGVSTIHPDMAKYIDCKIWLDIPADIALQRMVARDKANGDEHGELWSHWTESFQEYVNLYHPERLADIKINYVI